MNDAYSVKSALNSHIDGLYLWNGDQFCHTNGVYYLSKDIACFWIITIGKAKGGKGKVLFKSTSARPQPVGLKWLSATFGLDSQILISIARPADVEITTSKPSTGGTLQYPTSSRRAITPNLTSRPEIANSFITTRSSSTVRASSTTSEPVWSATRPSSGSGGTTDRYKSPISASRVSRTPDNKSTSVYRYEKSENLSAVGHGAVAAHSTRRTLAGADRTGSADSTSKTHNNYSNSTGDKCPSAPSSRSPSDIQSSKLHPQDTSPPKSSSTSLSSKYDSSIKYESKYFSQYDSSISSAICPPVPPTPHQTGEVTSKLHSTARSNNSRNPLPNKTYPVDRTDADLPPPSRISGEKTREERLEALARTFEKFASKPSQKYGTSVEDEFWGAQPWENPTKESGFTITVSPGVKPTSICPQPSVPKVALSSSLCTDTVKIESTRITRSETVRSTNSSVGEPFTTSTSPAAQGSTSSSTLSDRCAELLARSRDSRHPSQSSSPFASSPSQSLPTPPGSDASSSSNRGSSARRSVSPQYRSNTPAADLNINGLSKCASTLEEHLSSSSVPHLSHQAPPPTPPGHLNSFDHSYEKTRNYGTLSFGGEAAVVSDSDLWKTTTDTRTPGSIVAARINYRSPNPPTPPFEQERAVSMPMPSEKQVSPVAVVTAKDSNVTLPVSYSPPRHLRSCGITSSVGTKWRPNDSEPRPAVELTDSEEEEETSLRHLLHRMDNTSAMTDRRPVSITVAAILGSMPAPVVPVQKLSTPPAQQLKFVNKQISPPRHRHPQAPWQVNEVLYMKDIYDEDGDDGGGSSAGRGSCSDGGDDSDTDKNSDRDTHSNTQAGTNIEAKDEVLLRGALARGPTGRPAPSPASPKIIVSAQPPTSNLPTVQTTISSYLVNDLSGDKFFVHAPARHSDIHAKSVISSQNIRDASSCWRQVEPLWTRTIENLDREISWGHAELQRMAVVEKSHLVACRALQDTVARLEAQLQTSREKEQAAHLRAGTLRQRHGEGHVKRDHPTGTEDFPSGGEIVTEFEALLKNFANFVSNAVNVLEALVVDEDLLSVLVHRVIKPICNTAQQFVEDELSSKRLLMRDQFGVTLPVHVASSSQPSQQDYIPHQFWYGTLQQRLPTEIRLLDEIAVNGMLRRASGLALKLGNAMLATGNASLQLSALMRVLLRLHTVAALSDPRCFLHPAPGVRGAYKEGLHQEILSPGAKKHGRIQEGDIVEVVLPGLYFENPDWSVHTSPIVRCSVRRL